MNFFELKNQLQQAPPPRKTLYNVYVTYSHRNFTVYDN